MAQIGTKKMTLAGGTVVDVPIFEPADVTYPVRRIAAPDGTIGCLPAFPVSEGDLAYGERRFYHPTHGVMGFHDEATLAMWVEDFESGSLSHWGTVDSDHAATAAGAFEGNYGLESTGGGGSYVTSGLDFFPQPGDRFEFYVKPVWSNTPHLFRFHFAVQSLANQDDDAYSFWMEETGFTLRQYEGNTNQKTIFSGSWSTMAQDWHRIELKWYDSSPHSFDIIFEEVGGSTLHSETGGTATNTNLGTGGIGVWTNAYANGTSYDSIQILDRP